MILKLHGLTEIDSDCWQFVITVKELSVGNPARSNMSGSSSLSGKCASSAMNNAFLVAFRFLRVVEA